jgi:hypothetical protein
LPRQNLVAHAIGGAEDDPGSQNYPLRGVASANQLI